MKGLLARLSPTSRVVACSAIVSVAGGIFGFDTGSIGAISTMPYFESQFGILTPLVRGFVVAIILVPAAATGIFAGLLSDYVGRERSISTGCLIFALGSAISAASTSLAVLIFGRVLAGSGEGLFLSVIGVYICELSPIHIRGKMVLLVQLATTGAIAAGFFVCYATVSIPSNMSWRFPFILQAITSLTLGIVSPFLYQSPRWLLSKGRRSEAEAILDLLAGPENSDERREMLASTSNSGKFMDIFQKGVRGRTMLGVFLNVVQQLSGIDFVLFFAPLLFAQAGLSAHTSSFLASGVTGLVLLMTVMIGTLWIDKVGRRTLFLIGGVAISICEIMLGVLYVTGLAKTPIGKWFVIAFIELFAISFSGTWSLVVRLYSSEIQPSRTRGSATALGQGMNQAVNFIVAVTGPIFLAESSYGPYFLYGAFTAFGTLVAYIYMPEVRGVSLERIDNIFETSPYAIKWPALVSRSLVVPQVTELRQRRTSRQNSSTLPGETREEFRAQFKELDVVGSAIEE